MKVQRGTRGWKGRSARLQRRRERRPRPAPTDATTQVDDTPSSATSNQPDPITEEDWRDLFDTAALEQDSPNDLYQSSRNNCEIERLIETMLKLCRERLQCLDGSCCKPLTPVPCPETNIQVPRAHCMRLRYAVPQRAIYHPRRSESSHGKVTKGSDQRCGREDLR